jgi:hypothetical protein
MAVVLYTHRGMTIMFKNDRTIGTLALTQEHEVVGAGLYDQAGERTLTIR